MNATNLAHERWGMRAPMPEGHAVPTKEELDRRLERYLDTQEKAEREGVTLGAIKAAVQHVTDWTQSHEKKDDTRHDESSKRLEAIEKAVLGFDFRLGKAESDIKELKPSVREAHESLHDITESDLSDQLAETKRAKNELADRVWKYVMGVILGITLVVIGALLAKLGLK